MRGRQCLCYTFAGSKFISVCVGIIDMKYNCQWIAHGRTGRMSRIPTCVDVVEAFGEDGTAIAC
ncbi:hypothetical protein CY34DRAFT_802820 [Suillus luteus UH-Slu-Lm8-n1]|uniref:Uncharacterized protein n=1 Tax=Suillus luteus UH-Slu-Lm8-n1 TaxID=930992 RepID=A0A0D0BDL6_9AGAM|nr:hypothetical protein CY34DRAFT_802820 [Suillus luteus UH-Slu-Lm8-n1]